jgi:hypothetical protein
MKLDLEYDRVNAKLAVLYYCYVWTSLDLTTAASSGSRNKAILSNEVSAAASSGTSIVIHPIVNLKKQSFERRLVQYAKTPKSIERRANKAEVSIKYKDRHLMVNKSFSLNDLFTFVGNKTLKMKQSIAITLLISTTFVAQKKIK